MAQYTRTNTDNRPSTIDLYGVLFVFDGRSVPICCPDGEKFIYANLPYQITTGFERASLSAATGDPGNLIGDYQWYTAFYNVDLNAWGRSSRGSNYAEITADSDQVGLSQITTLEDISESEGIPMMFELYDPFSDDTSDWRISIFRNVAGASFVAGERPPFYRIGEIAYDTSTFLDDEYDENLEFSDQVPYGGVPVPMFKYACVHNGRIVGVGFDKYESPSQIIFDKDVQDEMLTSLSWTLGDGESYVFVPAYVDGSGDPVKPLPDWANIFSSNLKVRITSGQLIDTVYDVIFTDYVTSPTLGGRYYAIKLTNSEDGDNEALYGSYSFEIVESHSGSYYYSQRGYPECFSFGSPVYDSINAEGYRLNNGDSVVGCASAGSCVLILGKNSTSVHVDVSSDDNLPLWLQHTIDGGSLSHFSVTNVAGKVVCMSPDGPKAFKAPTQEEALGGYFGEWQSMDSDGSHTFLTDIVDEIDASDGEYASAIYNASSKMVEFSYSSVSRASGVHADKQIAFDVETGSWFPLDGRYKNCYDIWTNSDGESVIVHGDPYGCVQEDHTQTLDGGDDEMFVGITKDSDFYFVPVSAETASQTCPNYLGGTGTGFRYTLSTTNIDWADDMNPVGVRMYKVTYLDNGDYAVDTSSYQTIIDANRSGAPTIYLYTDGTETIAVAGADTVKRVAIGVIHAYVDSPAIEGGDMGVDMQEFSIRMNPVDTPQSAAIYGTSYTNEYPSEEAAPMVYPQPSNDGTEELVKSFNCSNGRGSTANIRIGSRTATQKVEVKELTIHGGTIGRE